MSEPVRDSSRAYPPGRRPPGKELRPVPSTRRPTISVVVPCFNEADSIDAFHARLVPAMDGLNDSWDVVYVNDGSHDETFGRLLKLRQADERVAVLNLSRNFGKEIALTAGLDHAAGEAVVVIDADLQDPPELIPRLVAEWRQGVDIVYGQRR